MKLIHSSIYDAAYTDDQGDGFGAMLCVTYRDKGGVALRGYQASKWANEISTAMDQAEADLICKAIRA